MGDEGELERRILDSLSGYERGALLARELGLGPLSLGSGETSVLRVFARPGAEPEWAATLRIGRFAVEAEVVTGGRSLWSALPRPSWLASEGGAERAERALETPAAPASTHRGRVLRPPALPDPGAVVRTWVIENDPLVDSDPARTRAILADPCFGRSNFGFLVPTSVLLQVRDLDGLACAFLVTPISGTPLRLLEHVDAMLESAGVPAAPRLAELARRPWDDRMQ